MNSKKPSFYPIAFFDHRTNNTSRPPLPSIFPAGFWPLPGHSQLCLVLDLCISMVAFSLDGFDSRRLCCMHYLRLCCSSWQYIWLLHWQWLPCSLFLILGVGNSEAGLIISVAMSLGRFQYGIRQSAEMEIQMTSVDRIIEYSKLPSEASFECCNIII